MTEGNHGLGRRGEALAETSRLRVVETGSVQNRHVRRNNLRVARETARAMRRKALDDMRTLAAHTRREIRDGVLIRRKGESEEAFALRSAPKAAE